MERVECRLMAFYVSDEDGNKDWDFAVCWYDVIKISVGSIHFDDECKHLEAWCDKYGFDYQWLKTDCGFVFD